MRDLDVRREVFVDVSRNSDRKVRAGDGNELGPLALMDHAIDVDTIGGGIRPAGANFAKPGFLEENNRNFGNKRIKNCVSDVVSLITVKGKACNRKIRIRNNRMLRGKRTVSPNRGDRR